jgi:hypothetical protein
MKDQAPSHSTVLRAVPVAGAARGAHGTRYPFHAIGRCRVLATRGTETTVSVEVRVQRLGQFYGVAFWTGAGRNVAGTMTLCRPGGHAIHLAIELGSDAKSGRGRGAFWIIGGSGPFVGATGSGFLDYLRRNEQIVGFGLEGVIESAPPPVPADSARQPPADDPFETIF